MGHAAVKWNRAFRRLKFGDIALVPAKPLRIDAYNVGDRWHLPGGDIKSTDDLLELARAKEVSVTLTEHDGDGVRTRLLN